jgi:hypothetical protein
MQAESSLALLFIPFLSVNAWLPYTVPLHRIRDFALPLDVTVVDVSEYFWSRLEPFVVGHERNVQQLESCSDDLTRSCWLN